MSRLLVIVPSRGRPANADRLLTAFTETASIDTELLFCLDDDDPELAHYPTPRGNTRIRVGERLRLGPTLNAAAASEATRYDYLGFMGDDHLPRTDGWDKRIIGELEPPGAAIVYGNDLLQGERLPTAFFMRSDIVQVLGWMCPPGLQHLFIDDAILALGHALNLGRAFTALRYLPDVVIEHVHPIAGKAAWDDGYVANNDDETWRHDEHVYRTWKANQLPADVTRIREACRAGTAVR